MNIYTAHTRPGRPPALVPEGFSLSALVFGPLWLFAHRAWLGGILVLCAQIAIGSVIVAPYRVVFLIALAWLVGLFGRDIVRWSLRLRGYTLDQVVAARNVDMAFSTLAERNPNLIVDMV